MIIKRSAAGVFLLELIIAVLILALSSTVIMELFVKAHRKSEQASALSGAILTAQTAAEHLRIGDIEGFEGEFVSCERTKQGYIARDTIGTEETMEVILNVELLQEQDMLRAVITAACGDQQYTLQTACATRWIS